MMRVIVLLSALAMAIVAAEDTRDDWQGNGYYRPEQAYLEEAEMEAVCGPITLSSADRKLAEALEGARSLPDIAPKPTKVVQPMACEEGPKKVIHSIEDEFHIPQIYKGSCSGLPCDVENCRIKRSQFKTKCVLVYRFQDGQWVRIGYRTVRYIDHLECECKQCKHITSRAMCVKTTTCPNANSKTSHCYWKSLILPSDGVSQQEIQQNYDYEAHIERLHIKPIPFGRCDCCTPYVCRPPKIFNKPTCSCKCRVILCKPPKYQDQNTCRCRCTAIPCKPPKYQDPNTCRCRCPPARCVPPRVQNPTTCNCDCPKGTTSSSGGKCVGNCRNVSPRICGHVYCEDNPSLTCKRNSPTARDCHCPSCAEATTATCTKAKCLEQPAKPACVINKETRKCDCPTCHHQNTPLACTATQCGKSPGLNCEFSVAYRRCHCPYTGCPPIIGK